MSTLNENQLTAYNIFISGQNIFLTGSGGCGKTYTIDYIKQWAKANNKNIGITASTGSAAVLIYGTTVHSFLNIGIAKNSAKILAASIKSKRTLYKLRKLDILVIDEISMICDDLLNIISEVLSIIRNSSLPFGGVQIVLSGDFFQLPPVEGDYCFKSMSWTKANLVICNFTKSVRQQYDLIFQDLLSRARYGICTDDDIKLLKSLKNKEFPHHIKPTKLYALNKDINAINSAYLSALLDKVKPNGIRIYKASYKNEPSQKYAKMSKIEDNLKLCTGAQVILTWNLDIERGLVNGARGIVEEVFDTRVRVKFVSGLVENIIFNEFSIPEDNIKISYMPLRLAWAITIHGSQGMTLDAIEIDIGDSIFLVGQAYTALSRAKNLDSIRIKDISKRSLQASEEVKSFYEINI
jgi:ATP-dependent DNA helicase PIF1